MIAPASLTRFTRIGGGVIGVTDRGELIVAQSHLLGFTDTLSLFDPRTGTVTPVVSRPTPKNPEAATSAIGGFVTRNADWVVWEEVGFWLEHADWRMWALDRATGKVREVASFDPGTDGQVAPGWASDLSLLGDIVTWSARRCSVRTGPGSGSTWRTCAPGPSGGSTWRPTGLR